jgi:hypothetical protein
MQSIRAHGAKRPVRAYRLHQVIAFGAERRNSGIVSFDTRRMTNIIRALFVSLLFTGAAMADTPAKADAPKAEAPKAEAPKADAPKADAPKTDAPKTVTKKTTTKKTTVKKATAKTEKAGEKTDAPKSDTKTAEKPATK